MNSTVLRIELRGTPEQLRALVALQTAFAQVCNALAPLVRDTRCWNRVTLHHLAYKQLRERFPKIGSQMVCNAIYSVSRTARLVFQNPASPAHLSRLPNGLPLMRFSDNCPVYFDRHTLGVKAGQLSMYTLDGRMRFDAQLSPEDEERFRSQKLREVVLTRKSESAFELCFWFGEDKEDVRVRPPISQQGLVPDYVKFEVSP